MELKFDVSEIKNYHSNSQIARLLTENWIKRNMYCPRCGNLHVKQFENNRPVADFYCPFCNNEYELKSKNGTLGNKINDGAYETMIERITGNQNPDFLFMTYSKDNYTVKNLMLIPKHFFVPDIIEKRKPLTQTARRAGWVGCNILIGKVPEQGRIPIISDGIVIERDSVIEKVAMSNRLEIKDLSSRGWVMDILNCINKISNQYFSLKEIYFFEPELQIKHPDNHNIKPKIRQQLQILRDKGFIEFLGNGQYKKIE
ncbi:MAG: restriction endonuclease [Peptococcaceae bacterium]|nr:restriction endonuclease [Peptococcaceae bacterium]